MRYPASTISITFHLMILLQSLDLYTILSPFLIFFTIISAVIPFSRDVFFFCKCFDSFVVRIRKGKRDFDPNYCLDIDPDQGQRDGFRTVPKNVL